MVCKSPARCGTQISVVGSLHLSTSLSYIRKVSAPVNASSAMTRFNPTATQLMIT